MSYNYLFTFSQFDVPPCWFLITCSIPDDKEWSSRPPPHTDIILPPFLFLYPKMTQFVVLKDFGVLKRIFEFCRDNDRVFLSHTCRDIRRTVSFWIPSKECFKTLTRPKILPEMFEENDGVFSLRVPTSSRDILFDMSMLGQVDLHQTGVKALTWLKTVTGTAPFIKGAHVLCTRFFLSDRVSDCLTERQVLVLKRRFSDNRDSCLFLHQRGAWGVVRSMLTANSSIKRFIFYSSSSDVADNCYASVFRDLSRRESKTEYLDLSGSLTAATIEEFPLLAWGLTGVMLRRLSNTAMAALLSTIVSRPDEAKLDCLQFESVSLNAGVESIALDILDTLPITKLLFSNTALPERGYLKVFSVLGSTSSVEKMILRKLRLSPCEVVQCLFLPTLLDSSITDLSLSSTHIPEEAADALAWCIEGSKFLGHLNLDGCRLGPVCMNLVVKAVEKSSLSALNLGGSDIGEFSHKLFKSVGINKKLRNLFLDQCKVCGSSSRELQWAHEQYRSVGERLYVSLRGYTKVACV